MVGSPIRRPPNIRKLHSIPLLCVCTHQTDAGTEGDRPIQAIIGRVGGLPPRNAGHGSVSQRLPRKQRRRHRGIIPRTSCPIAPRRRPAAPATPR
jgi:hypothetical protein